MIIAMSKRDMAAVSVLDTDGAGALSELSILIIEALQEVAMREQTDFDALVLMFAGHFSELIATVYSEEAKQ